MVLIRATVSPARANPAGFSAIGTKSVQIDRERRPSGRDLRSRDRLALAMLRLLRLALQVLLFFLLLGSAIGIGSGETGAIEKLALAALAGGLVWLAALVRRIGAPGRPRTS
jgi:hypothetical protein